MKQSAEQDDLSLIPHLTLGEKQAMRRAGVATVSKLAHLKELEGRELVADPSQEELVSQLAATWPVGPRLDELIHRARRYRRWKKEAVEALSFIPHKGYGSLPYCDAEHNPNLVRINLDAQHDYLQDRIYLLAARVVCSEAGEEVPSRQRSIVHLTESPPDTVAKEAALFIGWIRALLDAVVELAAPDPLGVPRAPIHLSFFDQYVQQVLLDGLSRHLASVLGATPLYDFMTQLAAYDSPLVSYLSAELREQKNYPMVCQSLQQVAAYLGFKWDDSYRQELLRERLFDFWGKFDSGELTRDESPWYTNRARFNNQIPLEYAYAAWGAAPVSAHGHDLFAPYRNVTLEDLQAFETQRVAAIEHVAKAFHGNRQTEKSLFDLPTLDQFADKARSLAKALDEFIYIERHVELGTWKATRNLSPERRALMGESLPLRFAMEHQEAETRNELQENEAREQLRQQYVADYLAEHPEAEWAELTKDQKKATRWSYKDLIIRFQVDTTNLMCSLNELL